MRTLTMQLKVLGLNQSPKQITRIVDVRSSSKTIFSVINIKISLELSYCTLDVLAC